MSSDPIERAIGRFDKYQTWVLLLLSIGRLPTEIQLTNVVFILPSVNYVCLDALSSNASNYCPCQNPVYDQSTIVSSVTSEWNLICDKTSLASLAQSIMQAGILAGSLLFGYLSDRHGRKPAILLSFSVEVLAVALSALVPEYWMFLVCRFVIGSAVGGTMLCCFVLLIELSGNSFIPYIIALNEASFVIGYLLCTLCAYFIREWRYLQLATSVPWVFVIVYWWLVPESPRWLITVGKKHEALRVLTHIAQRNKRSADNIEEIVKEIEEITLKESTHRGSYLDLFRTPKIRMYTIVMALMWLCCAHTYFGINQYIGRLPGNIYVNVALSAIFLLPGLLLCVVATINFKRKVGVIAAFVIAALSLLVFTFIPREMEAANLAFAIVGQTGAYDAFVLIYLYASELFPTVIRNSAMGFASVFARFGGFIAPFVINIDEEWVSIVVFSGVAFCAAILCCFLPETKGLILLNTINQTEEKQKKVVQSNL